jgi:transketolase
MHTIKPLDTDLLANLGAAGKPIITVEEHSVHGGLGEAVAAYLIQQGFFVPFQILGFPDEYTVTGSQTEIFDHYGLSDVGIQRVALNLLNR